MKTNVTATTWGIGTVAIRVLVVATVLRLPSVAIAEDAGLRLILPPAVYAVPNHNISVYFDNIVLTETPQKYRFDVECAVGRTESKRWTITPKKSDVGTHSLTVTVRDADGGKVGTASTVLHVVPTTSGREQEVSMLIVGDSLTHATAYPNELARLLSEPDNPRWSMFGTHCPANASDGVRHEGYGGWTWQRFVTQYEPKPDGTHRKRSSPFVFLDAAGKPALDLPRYFAGASDGQRPDVVFFLLGINDCFSADPNDAAAIDARIDTMMKQAGTLLTAFRDAAPQTNLAICITTPPNARESGFEANYKGRYHRWGWKRIQHRLVERLQKHFAAQTRQAAPDAGHTYLVPTHLNLDPVDGYPENNGVHPNGFGYRQIGMSLYCWLKWWTADRDARAAVRGVDLIQR